MHDQKYQTVVCSPLAAIVADTEKNGVGGAAGFRPHELLEAALAACTNLTLRISAEKLGIALAGLNTVVEMDSTRPDVTNFLLKVEIAGDLSDEQKRQLLKSVRLCPVSKIFSRPIAVVYDLDVTEEPA
jgi:putative redox protein